MKDPIENDNKYPRGTFIYAKVNPQVKLVINDYKQRIYFCAAVGDTEAKQLAYFERELLDPVNHRIF